MDQLSEKFQGKIEKKENKEKNEIINESEVNPNEKEKYFKQEKTLPSKVSNNIQLFNRI